MKYLIALLLPLTCFANVSMNPGGQTYNVDSYGADCRRPTKQEMDCDTSGRLTTPIHRSIQIPLNGVKFSNVMVAE